MKASIIVRAYNEAEHIGKLFFGLGMQTEQDFEVILVDSGSNDNTVQIAEENGAKIVHIKKSDFSFGRAINIGAEQASGDYLVLVSAHVFPVTENWLKLLLAPFQDDATSVSYGKQRGDTVNKFSEHQVFKSWFPSYLPNPNPEYFCNNANCAIRKKDWKKRKYDESLTGLEDLDWAKKSFSDGGRIVYVSDATIIHTHNENWPQVRNRYMREAIALNFIQEGNLSFSLYDVLKLFLSNVLYDLRESIREGVLFSKAVEIILFRWNQFYGTYLGFQKKDSNLDALRRRFYYPNDKKIDFLPNEDFLQGLINYEDFDKQNN